MIFRIHCSGHQLHLIMEKDIEIIYLKRNFLDSVKVLHQNLLVPSTLVKFSKRKKGLNSGKANELNIHHAIPQNYSKTRRKRQLIEAVKRYHYWLNFCWCAAVNKRCNDQEILS
ncbi:hypothetical protein B9Z55_017572 [Caenorhabditis nigoni]|uniref:Uncharacterized protein n=1 Tax=Caenorhabditis nigoni TaxID=1611254 RepID=A0A2G5TAJ9_9PELO|nr:hypothetical protein B9Z55_017572 [Caenorhabditis nigoni]